MDLVPCDPARLRFLLRAVCGRARETVEPARETRASGVCARGAGRGKGAEALALSGRCFAPLSGRSEEAIPKTNGETHQAGC